MVRRVEASFACKQDWKAMGFVTTGVQRCASCRRDVRFGLGYADFQRLASKGHCLARPDRLSIVIQALVGQRFARSPAEMPGGPPLRTVFGAPPCRDPPAR